MTKEQTQDERRASVKISVDKIRRNLTVIDVNVTPLADAADMCEAREACHAIDTELVRLGELLRGIDAAK